MNANSGFCDARAMQSVFVVVFLVVSTVKFSSQLGDGGVGRRKGYNVVVSHSVQWQQITQKQQKNEPKPRGTETLTGGKLQTLSATPPKTPTTNDQREEAKKNKIFFVYITE